MAMLLEAVTILGILQAIQALQGYETVVAVYNSKEEYSNCSYGASYNYTIDKLPTANLTNGTLLKFCSKSFTLNRTLVLFDLLDIAMIGTGSSVGCTNDREAGMLLKSVQNYTLNNIAFENCQLKSRIFSDPAQNIEAGVIIQDSTDITIVGLTIRNSPGVGLAMFYNNGSIRIQDSVFEGNGDNQHSGGSGVYIETGPSSSVVNHLRRADYDIVSSKFQSNKATSGQDRAVEGFSQLDKGGGLSIHIINSKNVNILVSNSCFIGNEAKHCGGGLFASYYGNSSHSNVKVQSTVFVQNKAQYYGGATYSGYEDTLDHDFLSLQMCRHFFKDVNFMENSAYYGGGSILSSSRTSNPNPDNRIVSFENCTWTRNSGQYGSAVAFLPKSLNLYSGGYLPTPSFSKCSVLENKVQKQTRNEIGHFQEYSKGIGAFYCFGYNIFFMGNSLFRDNTGTALYLDWCASFFEIGSFTLFKNNSGYQGGAIHMSSAVIYVSDESEVHFFKNTAEDKGGAIYDHTSSILACDHSSYCFIDYNGDENDVDKRNIYVEFENNSALSCGHSIYISSLIPCSNRFSVSATNLSDIFNQIGRFDFPLGDANNLVTAVNHTDITNLSWSKPLPFTPGKVTTLPFTDIDDFNHSIQSHYSVTINNEINSTITTQPDYSQVTNNKILLYGKRNDVATITLTDTSPRHNILSFNVTMQACPPGFILNETSQSCICANDNTYVGIDFCNNKKMIAYSKPGYWFGYKTNETENEDTLISGFCPKGLCKHSESPKPVLLPDKANEKELNQVMCSENNKGILCGECNDNCSIYFHSLEFKCTCNSDGSICNDCNLGWLFYVLSEIIPVTIIFLLIILFNVPFTSGLVNGFIFYCQVVEVIRFQSMGLIPYANEIQEVHKVISLIYLSFSLDMFVYENLSFCFRHSNNKAIDVLRFKYVTIIYILLLITFLFVINHCSKYFRCTRRHSQRLSNLMAHLKFKGGILHGLSAFFILGYVQCARCCFMLLATTQIYEKTIMIISLFSIMVVVLSSRMETISFNMRFLLFSW